MSQIRICFSSRNTVSFQLDERFGRLNCWAKNWLNAMGAKDSLNYKLSSYHIALLVVHFLQSPEALEEPVLPLVFKTYPHLLDTSLSIQHFADTLQLDAMDFLVEPNYESRNEMSLAELSVRMVEYYAKNVDFSSCGISIAEGKLVERLVFGVVLILAFVAESRIFGYVRISLQIRTFAAEIFNFSCSDSEIFLQSIRDKSV